MPAAPAHAEGWSNEVRIHRVQPLRAAGSPGLFYGAGAPEALEASRDRARVAVWTQATSFFARLAHEARQRSQRWTEVEAHWLVPCGLVAAALARPGLLVRAWAHSGDVALLERMPVGRALARFLAARMGSISFVSEDLRGRFARLCGGDRASFRVETLPLPPSFAARVDEEAPRLRERLLTELGSRRLVVAAGRLVPIKGFDVLVRALGHVPQRDRPGLVVLGQGPEHERLARLARACRVAMALPGSVPRLEVARHLRAADLCVVPSRPLPNGRTEGLPIVAREAIAVGTPVVASRTGGLAELPAHRVDLVPPGCPPSLAHCIMDVLDRSHGV